MELHYVTFGALVKNADFTSQPQKRISPEAKIAEPTARSIHKKGLQEPQGTSVDLGGLVYNIQIVLPESRDPSVYDALFRSLREHLL